MIRCKTNVTKHTLISLSLMGFNVCVRDKTNINFCPSSMAFLNIELKTALNLYIGGASSPQKIKERKGKLMC